MSDAKRIREMLNRGITYQSEGTPLLGASEDQEELSVHCDVTKAGIAREKWMPIATYWTRYSQRSDKRVTYHISLAEHEGIYFLRSHDDVWDEDRLTSRPYLSEQEARKAALAYVKREQEMPVENGSQAA